MRAISLLFHDVYETSPDESGFLSAAANRYKLRLADFDAQLEGVAQVRSDAPIVVNPSGGSKEQDPPYVVTVDDGGVSYHTIIAGRLEQRGWRGHCFVSTDFIGQRGFLTADQIRDLDARGHVIGIATAIATLGGGRSGSIGLGFAIPVNKARTIVQQLIRDGEAEYPIIGVNLDLTYPGPGARVQEDSLPGDAVTPDGPADDAGITAGDLIVAVDGDRVNTPEDFVVQIRTRLPGDVVELTVVRGDERLKLPVTLGATVG